MRESLVSSNKSRIFIGLLLSLIVFISYFFNFDFLLIVIILVLITYDLINIKILNNFYVYFLSILTFFLFYAIPQEILENIYIIELFLIIFLIFSNKYRKKLFIISIYIFCLIFNYVMIVDRNIFYIIILISFINDTVAYISGTMLRGPLIVPNISPKKTWNGTVISMSVSSLILYLFNFNIIFSILTSLFLFFGDIFFSFIKRNLKIKDFSLLLKSHGGILDRIDSMFFVVIIFQIYLNYFQ